MSKKLRKASEVYVAYWNWHLRLPAESTRDHTGAGVPGRTMMLFSTEGLAVVDKAMALDVCVDPGGGGGGDCVCSRD